MKTVEELEARLEVATRERDEARAYAEDRNDEANKLQRYLNIAAAERDEARAEVERLYKANAKWIAGWVRTGIEPNDVPHHESYRRGAEAMREAAARELDRLLTEKKATAIWVSPDDIRALPIPEER